MAEDRDPAPIDLDCKVSCCDKFKPAVVTQPCFDDCDAACKVASAPPINSNCSEYDSSSDPSDPAVGVKGNCVQCPLECRWNASSGVTVPTYCSYLGTCDATHCKDECKIAVAPPTDLNGDGIPDCATPIPPATVVPLNGGANCENCPVWCRLDQNVPGCENYECFGQTCNAECKTFVPAGPCDNCLNCPTDCTTKPVQIRTDCASECSNGEEGVNFDPAGFVGTMFGSMGAAGSKDTKMIGIFAIPAIVLPLFNIVMAISLIRVLSPFLGGDVEIPGLAKLI